MQAPRTRSARNLYISLLKDALSFRLWPEPPVEPGYFAMPGERQTDERLDELRAELGARGLGIYQQVEIDPRKQANGEVFRRYADTMIGNKRLDQLDRAVRTVLKEDIPGDLIETGVWRGGACILMKGVLEAFGDTARRVFVADSFQGLPEPEERAPADAGATWHEMRFLAVSEDQVRANFERYGLLDERVIFLKGFFADTLPEAPIEQLSVLRLDGDMYSSTMDALTALYDKLSPGGFLIVDDYTILPCRAAVEDFRARRGIEDEVERIDRTAAFWRKSG